jgi:hypothetical protein
MPHTKIKSYLIKTSNFSILPSLQKFLDPVPNRITLKKLHSYLFATVIGTELEIKAVKQFQIKWPSNPV